MKWKKRAEARSSVLEAAKALEVTEVAPKPAPVAPQPKARPQESWWRRALRRARSSREDLRADCLAGEHWLTPWRYGLLETPAGNGPGLSIECWRSWCRVCGSHQRVEASEPPPRGWSNTLSRRTMARRVAKRLAAEAAERESRAWDA